MSDVSFNWKHCSWSPTLFNILHASKWCQLINAATICNHWSSLHSHINHLCTAAVETLKTGILSNLAENVSSAAVHIIQPIRTKRTLPGTPPLNKDLFWGILGAWKDSERTHMTPEQPHYCWEYLRRSSAYSTCQILHHPIQGTWTKTSFGAFLRYKVGDLGSGIRGNCSLKDPSICGNESGKSKKDDFGNQLCF